MDANKRRRLHALQSVSQLHPLSLECVHTADALVQDLAKEVAEEALLVAGGVVTCSEEVKALLEGARGTLPNGDEKVSKPLFALLSEEAAKISAERSAAQKALAPGAYRSPFFPTVRRAVSVLLEPSRAARACPIFRFPDIIAAATGLRNETQSSHSLVLLLAPVSSLEASLSVLAILILDGVEGSALRTVEL